MRTTASLALDVTRLRSHRSAQPGDALPAHQPCDDADGHAELLSDETLRPVLSVMARAEIRRQVVEAERSYARLALGAYLRALGRQRPASCENRSSCGRRGMPARSISAITVISAQPRAAASSATVAPASTYRRRSSSSASR